MPDPIIIKILSLQERDRRISQLKAEASEIPQRKEMIATRLQSHGKAQEEAKDKLLHVQAKIKDLEVQVEGTKDQITKYQTQQFEVKDNEAYRTLEKEIKTARGSITTLEDSELELMEEQELMKAGVADADKALAREKDAVKQEQQVLDNRLQEITAEIGRLTAERAERAQDVDEDWLSRYERTFSHKGDFALVNTAGGNCHGCHMKLPPQLVHDAKRTETITVCSYCGRMLYFET